MPGRGMFFKSLDHSICLNGFSSTWDASECRFFFSSVCLSCLLCEWVCCCVCFSWYYYGIIIGSDYNAGGQKSLNKADVFHEMIVVRGNIPAETVGRLWMDSLPVWTLESIQVFIISRSPNFHNLDDCFVCSLESLITSSSASLFISSHPHLKFSF